MLLYKALRNRSVFLIWLGQLLSCIGDEVFRISTIWIVAGIVGPDTGLIAATLLISILVVAIVGSKNDHRDPYRTLMGVDLIRGVMILVAVALSYVFSLSLPLIWITSIMIVGLGGLFEPALQSVLPRYCEDTSALQAANGLMSTTIRMARVCAPTLIGVLTLYIPMVHFLTLDAFTYFFSAFSIYLLLKHPLRREITAAPLIPNNLWKSLKESVVIIKSQEGMWRAMWIKSATNGLWQLSYSVGLALLVKEKFSSNLAAYGTVMGAYGAGNIITALIIGNRERKQPEKLFYLGVTILGLGFIFMKFTDHLVALSAVAAFCAIGGPLNDITFMDLAQKHYNVHDLPKLIRFRTAGETVFTLLAMILSAALFRLLKIENVILLTGVVISAIGIYGGILSFRKTGILRVND